MMAMMEKMMNITTAITPVEKGANERETLPPSVHSRETSLSRQDSHLGEKTKQNRTKQATHSATFPRNKDQLKGLLSSIMKNLFQIS